MLTYKVLLVDDEEEVMDTIEHRISWNEMGFEVIGKARNGVKALEISEKMQPDVVITDIKMPYMDGLELARNLKQDNPDMRIFLCLSYDNLLILQNCHKLFHERPMCHQTINWLIHEMPTVKFYYINVAFS